MELVWNHAGVVNHSNLNKDTNTELNLIPHKCRNWINEKIFIQNLFKIDVSIKWAIFVKSLRKKA